MQLEVRRSRGSTTLGGALLGALLTLAGPGEAASLPNQTAWAAGTNWQYETNFLGFPGAWVYVPTGFSARAPNQRGLVFHLIGCGQMPFQAAQASGWPDAAEQHGLVVVVPGTIAPAKPNGDAPNVECLNYGYDGAYGVRNPSRTDRDHAAIIAAAQTLPTDPLYAAWAIDPDQVYVAGLSAGGAVAVQVGCMAPDVFAGVATAAAPGIGTAQGTAVMPPPFGFDKDSVKQLCTQWANGSSDPSKLADQVYAIITDDNGLPAGNGPLDTSKFNNQRIWDGDKFCPHVYGGVRAEAFSELLGLTLAQSQVAVGTGTGIGCMGGENSRGDTGDVECVINDFVTRPWTALADLYTDTNGATRLVRIQQDTLRHSWPSGPLTMRDVEATPTRTELRADDYIDTSTGEFDRSRMGSALNGQYGTIYFNHQAMDFPMFVAELWTQNNPRLGPPGGLDAPPSVADLAVSETASGAAFDLDVTGRATDPQTDDVIDRLQLVLTTAAGAVVGMVDVPGNGTNTLPFTGQFLAVSAGAYTLTVRITAGGATLELPRNLTVGGPANQPPSVTLDMITSSGDCLRASGTASDADGALAGVEITVLGLGPAPATLSGGTWSYEVCGLVRGKYPAFVIATDDGGAKSPESPLKTAEVGEATGGLEQATGTLTEHIDAGRVTRFTAEWYRYREDHCTQTGLITWECTPYTLYRCVGDTAWTDVMPSCGMEMPLAQVAVGLSMSVDRASVEVGEVVTVTLTVDNAGPDAASAAHTFGALPAGLAFVSGPDCVAGESLRCHLRDLAAATPRVVQAQLRATAAGTATWDVSASSAQSAQAVTSQVSVQITEPTSQPDAGVEPTPDAGVGPAPDTGVRPQPPQPSQPDAGVWGDSDAGDATPGGNSGCTTVDPIAGLGPLGLLGFGLWLGRRRRSCPRTRRQQACQG